MTRIPPRTTSITALLLTASTWCGAADYTVDQTNKTFSVTELKIKVGDRVSFKNSDPFFHNVYSMSDTKTFDLGSYPKGKEKSVLFDKEGKVEVECAIHPGMRMTVEVTR